MGGTLAVVKGLARRVNLSKLKYYLFCGRLTDSIRSLAQETFDFMTFCVNHDEWEHSLAILRQHLTSAHST